MKSLLASFNVWLCEVFAERDEFGLTDRQRNHILTLARKGEAARDFSERVACSGYGLRTSQFYKLMHQHGISCR